MSAEKKLSALHADKEFAVSRGLKDELLWVQAELKLALEEKNVIKAEMEQQQDFRSKLEQAHAKGEAEKRADVEVQGLQEDVQLYKEIKYHEGYRDDAKDKPPRYPLMMRCNLQSPNPSRCLQPQLMPLTRLKKLLSEEKILSRAFCPGLLSNLT